MALSRRTGVRFQASIWPGFVDAMTGLLLVLMFVLTIFMVVQFVLREEISGQADELTALSGEVAALADALGLEQTRRAALDDQVGALTATLGDARVRQQEQADLIARLQSQTEAQRSELAEAATQITAFEAQVMGLLAQQQADRDQIVDLEAARAALLADLQREGAAAAAREMALSAEIDALEQQVSEEERARLLEAAAAEALRARLQNADTELTALTLALEDQRRAAEETLTLLAAAEAAQAAAEADAATQLSEAQARAALLAQAQAALSEQSEISTEAQRQQALLNQQVAALRAQLGELQGLLDASEEREAATGLQLQSLGNQLNTALARVAAEERRRRALEVAEERRLREEQAEEARRRAEAEAAERARLEAEKADLERFRSEFFGRLRAVLENQDRVRVVGDRFVFSSEVLFAPGQARLSEDGRAELANIADILRNVAVEIPEEIDWVIQVDGHTDTIPITGGGAFADNWELSQARALSVVRYMIDPLDIPPQRLSANGFGEYQPINPADTPEARAQNRRIELKLTER